MKTKNLITFRTDDFTDRIGDIEKETVQCVSGTESEGAVCGNDRPPGS